jgi:TATA-binding protein-associated factor
VIIDPSKGGQVETAQSNTLSLTKMIEVSEGIWPWEGVIRVLEVDLFDPSWTTRHGAACAIRDILKPQGACAGMSSKLSPIENQQTHERWCNDLAAKILCVLVLDRFCDFSSDQVNYFTRLLEFITSDST